MTGDANSRVRERIRARWRAKRESIVRALNEPVAVKFLDKVSFTVGVLLLILAEYVVLQVRIADQSDDAPSA